jgi:hypothetical protein
MNLHLQKSDKDSYLDRKILRITSLLRQTIGLNAPAYQVLERLFKSESKIFTNYARVLIGLHKCSTIDANKNSNGCKAGSKFTLANFS